MSTRSNIAVVNPNGSVTSIYCHYDGYLSHVGDRLVKHYDTLEKAQALVTLGALSSIGQYIKAPPLPKDHDPLDLSHPDQECVYYHRDRGEPEENTKPYQFENLTVYRVRSTLGNIFEQFNYLFWNNTWYIHGGNGLYRQTTISGIPMAKVIDVLNNKTHLDD